MKQESAGDSRTQWSSSSIQTPQVKTDRQIQSQLQSEEGYIGDRAARQQELAKYSELRESERISKPDQLASINAKG